ASLFGWQGVELPAGDFGTYTSLRRDGKEVGILYRQTREARAARAASHWTPFVFVEDVDRTALRVRELGSVLLREPLDFLDAGRVAAVRDPTGGIPSLSQPRTYSARKSRTDLSALCWCELLTDDVGRAKSFYRELLGWEYQADPSRQTTIANGGSRIGAMRKRTSREAEMRPSGWIPYFGTESAQDTRQKPKSGGDGRSANGPIVRLRAPRCSPTRRAPRLRGRSSLKRRLGRRLAQLVADCPLSTAIVAGSASRLRLIAAHAQVEGGRDLVERGDHVGSTVVGPGPEQVGQLALERADKRFRGLSSLRTQLDHGHASVFTVAAAADEAAPRGAVDEAGHVRLVTAKRLRERTNRGGPQGGTEQLRLLGCQAMLAACPLVGVVECGAQPPECLRNRPRPATRPVLRRIRLHLLASNLTPS